MGKVNSSCRNVLWFLAFTGFAVSYMLGVILNLVIVAMVLPRETPVASTQCNEFEPVAHQETSISNITTVSSVTWKSFDESISLSNRYDWNEYDQHIALGAYFWIHWASQLPGGILTRRYGTKLIFGGANLITAILGLFIPFLTHYHFYGLVVIRVLQGFIAGVVWPSMHDMIAKWVPQDERSKFVSAFHGTAIGVALSYPLCVVCIDWFGWESVFYASSLIGIIWYGFWYFLVFDTPQEHPRISDTEKQYIIENIQGIEFEKTSHTSVPWRQILTSGPLWLTIIAHWGGVWGVLTTMTETPTYFANIHGWNIQAIGFLSGMPYLFRMGFGCVFGVLCDWLLRTKRMSLTNVRKLATFISTGLPGLLMLGLAVSGCHPILAALFMTLSITANGAASGGTLANFIDLSPNYASILFGFAGLITGIAGFLSPIVVGVLTNHNQTIGQWRLVFIITAANLCLSDVAYTFWGTAKEQPWNSGERSDAASPQELQCLKSISTKENDDAKMNKDKVDSWTNETA